MDWLSLSLALYHSSISPSLHSCFFPFLSFRYCSQGHSQYTSCTPNFISESAFQKENLTCRILPHLILISAMLLGFLFLSLLMAPVPTLPRTNNLSSVQSFLQPASLAILCWTHHQEIPSSYPLNPISLGSISFLALSSAPRKG